MLVDLFHHPVFSCFTGCVQVSFLGPACPFDVFFSSNCSIQYDSELNILLDQLTPLRQVSRRQRTSDLYFDKECRDAKRVTRRLERTCAVASRRVVNVSVHSTADSVDVAATAATAKVVRYNQRRLYRQLVRRKSAAFWCKKIDADRADPQGLWRSVDKLLGRDRTTASEIIDGDTFNRYFIDKVSKVRLSTSGATPPTYSHSRSGVSFTAFLLVNVDTVIDAVQQLPDKSSAADPMPTLVLKQVVDLVAPFLTELFNRLMAAGHFPSGFKQAFITPIV